MSKNGFTLIEVMVALMMLASITLSFSYSTRMILHSRHISEEKLSTIMSLKSVIEKLSAIKFDELAVMNSGSINGIKVCFRSVSNDLIEVTVGDSFAIRTLRGRYN